LGLTDKLRESRRRKLGAYVAEELPEAGAVEAMIPMVGTANPMLKGAKFYGLAITPDQIVVARYPRTSETPNGIEAAYARAEVSVEKWKPGMVSSKLLLGTPDGTFKIDVPRIHRDDGEEIVTALGGAPA